jgi:ubiquinone biosynthesis protein UbiJ
MLICMHSTSVRIDSVTHDELKRLARVLGLTVGQTVSMAVRTLRQERAGRQMAAPLTDEESAWLDADFG